MTTLDLHDVFGRLRAAAAGPPDTPAPPLRDVDLMPAHVPGPIAYRRVDRGVPVPDDLIWIDGIQAKHTVCYARHRPVIAQYAAAVAVDRELYVVDHLDQVRIVCSAADASWVRTVVADPWLEIVPDGFESAIRASAHALLDEARRSLERQLSGRVLATGAPVVVDGPLTGHPASPLVAGVIKSHQVRYLDPERHLYELDEGEMTWPPFEILDGETGRRTGRHSCYLRLHDHRFSSCMTGLVRLEACHTAMLGPLARMCMAERQFAGCGDDRWDRQVIPVAWAETLGRQMAPRW